MSIGLPGVIVHPCLGMEPRFHYRSTFLWWWDIRTNPAGLRDVSNRRGQLPGRSGVLHELAGFVIEFAKAESFLETLQDSLVGVIEQVLRAGAQISASFGRGRPAGDAAMPPSFQHCAQVEHQGDGRAAGLVPEPAVRIDIAIVGAGEAVNPLGHLGVGKFQQLAERLGAGGGHLFHKRRIAFSEFAPQMDIEYKIFRNHIHSDMRALSGKFGGGSTAPPTRAKSLAAFQLPSLALRRYLNNSQLLHRTQAKISVLKQEAGSTMASQNLRGEPPYAG